MKFGLMFANAGAFATPDGAAAVGRAAEDAGFESLWAVEHVVVPAGYESEYPYDKSGRMPGGESVDIPDPFVWLTFVAARTSTIRLGTGILILPQRNPLIVAKEAATLDQLSGGRFLMGVGVGWLREEFEALGVPFTERGARTDDHIEAMRALWSQDQADHDGRFTSFSKAISRPKPTRGSIPIIVGGHSEPAARRAGRLGDGFFPGRGDTERLRHLLDVMRASAEEAGRDPDEIEITAGTPAIFAEDAVEQLGRFEAELGIDRVIVPPLAFDPDGLTDALASFGERVIAPLR